MKYFSYLFGLVGATGIMFIVPGWLGLFIYMTITGFLLFIVEVIKETK